jgi:hypothetical protein
MIKAKRPQGLIRSVHRIKSLKVFLWRSAYYMHRPARSVAIKINNLGDIIFECSCLPTLRNFKRLSNWLCHCLQFCFIAIFSLHAQRDFSVRVKQTHAACFYLWFSLKIIIIYVSTASNIQSSDQQNISQMLTCTVPTHA